MGRVFFFVFLFFAAAIASAAHAYVPTLSSGGGQVRWQGQVKLNIAGNPTNVNGLSESGFFNAAVRSLQRWQQAAGGPVQFDYWQGTNQSVYESDSDYNGLSSLYFASNAIHGTAGITPSILGLTQVWYNTNSGQILETDTVLNDLNFNFTTNPADTSGYGNGTPTYGNGKMNVFVENVLTHEFGHALGLSHSGTLQSTMLFMESPEQAHLGCDEQLGIHALYPSGDASLRGSLSGHVSTSSGASVFGAEVLAVSRRRGVVLAGGMTDHSGNYTIGGLEPGTYFLIAEPYYAGGQALPAFYSGISNSCGNGQIYSRSALVDGTGYRPLPVTVFQSGTSSAPNIVVACSSGSGADIAGNPSSSSSSSAPEIYNSAVDGSGFGALDRFTSSSTLYYHLHGVSGHVEIHALAYSLYSPVRPYLRLIDMSGNAVQATVDSPVYQGDSGYVNYDSSLTADGLSGDYILEVSGSGLNSLDYPAGMISIDSVPFVMVTGSVNEGAPGLASSVSENARCRMQENFPGYQSPAGDPPRGNTSQDSGGGCGTIDTGSRRDGGGPGPGAIAGWLLPWAVMGLAAQLARLSARRSRRRV